MFVKYLVKDLPRNDYSVLKTRLWVETWFHFIINQSLSSMRGLTSYFNATGTQFNIRTFSRANQNRNPQLFIDIYKKFATQVRCKSEQNILPTLALDSTTITLTSKLFHLHNFREAKLLCSHNSDPNSRKYISSAIKNTRSSNVHVIKQRNRATGYNAYGSRVLFTRNY
jgi:putative transposase